MDPSPKQCSTSKNLNVDASPKAISERTSYLQVRLEFLRYPQVIQALFNVPWFGPPVRLTAPSTCSWVGHMVSGLRHDTNPPYSDSVSLRLRLFNLTSHHIVTRRFILQKARSHHQRARTCCRHTVSGSISLPSRGAFHLSLTVLVHYRSLGSI